MAHIADRNELEHTKPNGNNDVELLFLALNDFDQFAREVRSSEKENPSTSCKICT